MLRLVRLPPIQLDVRLDQEAGDDDLNCCQAKPQGQRASILKQQCGQAGNDGEGQRGDQTPEAGVGVAYELPGHDHG